MRVVVLAVCASLLALLVMAGSLAIYSLFRMHDQETAVRRTLTERTQMLIGLWASVENYRQAVDQLAKAPAREDRLARPRLDQLARQIDSELQHYPSQEDAEETALIHIIEDVYHQQREFYIAIVTASPMKQAPVIGKAGASREAPNEELIRNWPARLSTWNGQRLQNADRTLLAEFAAVRRGLARAMGISFGSGLLLTSLGAAYILRLERQTRARYAELARSRQDLQELSAQLVDAQESERRSISRELHDEIGQSLGALLVDIGRLSAHSTSLDPAIRTQLGHMRSIAERSFQAVRNIALLLRPSMLDDLGLQAALDWLGREVSRNSHVEVSVESGDVPQDLSDAYKVCIYRLTQGALHNAVKHSSARNATVRVKYSKQGIRLTVADDGRGFDPARTRGMGLLGMEERVKRLGGIFRIESQPGRGATVTAELPPPSGSGVSE
jgi:signal transduction histidine kinase